MGKLSVDELLIFSRKSVLATISKALLSSGHNISSPANGAKCNSAMEDIETSLCIPSPGAEKGRAQGLNLPRVLAIDATAGNGVDTEFMAQAVENSGLVLAFDIQPEALEKTGERLRKFQVASRVRLIHDSHEHIESYFQPYCGSGLKVCAAMYNLGFLPGGSSRLATQAVSTIESLTRLLPFMGAGSIISIHCYTGHDEGMGEFKAVERWVNALSWHEWKVLRYEFCNKPVNREVLFLITCI